MLATWPGAVSSPKQIAEVDRGGQPLDRPEGGGEVHVFGGEGAGAGRAFRTPRRYRPRPLHHAVDQRHHAQRQPRELLGLIVFPEADAGTSSTALPRPLSERMVDRCERYARARVRIGKPAGGGDPVLDHRQPEIVRDERIEAGQLRRVRHSHRAADCDPSSKHAPVAARVAQQQGHVAKLAVATREDACNAICIEAAGKARKIKPANRFRPPQPDGHFGAREAAFCKRQPDLVGAQSDRRLSQSSRKARLANQRAALYRSARRLPQHGAPGGTEAKLRSAKPQALGAKRAKTDGSTAFPKAKPPPAKRPLTGSSNPSTRPSLNGPSIIAVVSTRVAPPDAAVKRTCVSCSLASPTAIGAM
jgi:hypothetical protein